MQEYLQRQDAVLVESEHPYRNDMDEHRQVTIPGARYILVAFDPITSTEPHADYVTFHTDDTHTSFYGLEKYHGGRHFSSRNWPGFGNRPVLAIPADRFVVSFHTDSSNVCYGYRFVAWRDDSYVDPWDEFRANHPGGVIVDSPHPYTNNMDSYYPFSVQGQRSSVVFHQNSAVEAGCDYVVMYAEDPRDNGNESAPPRSNAKKLTNNLSGRPVFPHTVGQGEPLTVCTGQGWFYFHTDGSNVDWGWRAYVYPVEDPLSAHFSNEWSTIIETEHPYSDNMNESWPIHIPGAASLEIAFDDLSSTETNYDYVSFWNRDESERIGSEKYHGGRGNSAKNFPTIESPLVVRGDFVLVRFITDASNTDWGFRLCVRPGPGSNNADLRAAAEARNSQASTYETAVHDPGAIIVETTGHPYQNNEDQWGEVRIPGASAIGIIFSPETCSERSYDWLRIHKDDPRSGGSDEYWGPNKLTGPTGSWPGQGSTPELVIPADHFTWHWVTDGSNTEWGFRFVAHKTTYVDPMQEFLDKPYSQVLESRHPYLNNMDEHTAVSIPGSRYIMVAFAPESSTESNCDYVTFHKDGTHSAYWGTQKYHGGRGGSASNWPGCRGRPPLAIPADNFVVSFHTDGSNVDHGWKMVVWQDNNYVDPWNVFMSENPGGMVVESEHPYTNNYNGYYHISVAGAAMSLAFHPNSATESGCDYITVYAEDPRDGGNNSAGPRSDARKLTSSISGRPVFPHTLGSDPLTLPVNDAWIHFHTDGSNVDWGWLCYAYPSQDALQAWGGNVSAFVESAHPYENNENEAWLVRIPGAETLEVAFDVQMSCTESGYDWISFWDEAGNERYGEEKYHGGRGGSAKNFPDMDHPLFIRSSAVVVRFRSDASNTEWGFRLCVRPGPGSSSSGLSASAVKLYSSFNAMCNEPGAIVRETSHPYGNNEDVYGTVQIPGAHAIGIMFSSETATEQLHDYLTIYKEDPRNGGSSETWMYKFTGGVGRWPGQNRPAFVIPSDHFVWHWHSDGSNTEWGYKFVAYSTEYVDPLAEYLSKPGARIIESEHPYANNVDQHIPVSIPGSRFLRVAFDPFCCHTEPNCDFVTFHRDSTYETFHGLEKYTGGRFNQDSNWPGVGGREPLAIRGDNCIVTWHTDGSNVDQGWRMVIWQDNDYVDPWDDFKQAHPGGVEYESEHPYANNTNQVIELSLGSPAMNVIFHPNSRTESGADWVAFYSSDPSSNENAPKLQDNMSGRPDFPHSLGKGDPLCLRASRAWLKFHTDHSVTDWGWKCYVWPGDDEIVSWGGSSCTIVESLHPYANNLDDRYIARIPGASALEVAFDPTSSTESGYDYVSFHLEADGDPVVGEPKYHGGRGGSAKNYPTVNSPLRIEADSVVIKFHTDGSNVDWGWRLCVRAVPGSTPSGQPMSSILNGSFASLCSQPGSQVAETSHPYVCNANDWGTITMPGAEAIAVIFAPETCCEAGHDYLRIYKNDPRSGGGEEMWAWKLTGQAGKWPGQGDRAPFIIPADHFVYNWHTDSSGVEWGYKFCAYPTNLTDLYYLHARDSSAVLLESAHPYSDNTDTTQTVHIPGARTILVAFAPGSRTERNCDYVVCHAPGNREATLSPRFTGGRYGGEENWPGTEGRPPVAIRSDHFEVHFHTDSSNFDYGWRMVAWRDDDFADPWEDFKAAHPGGFELESAHPYANSVDDYYPLNVNGEAMCIIFHPNSRCEGGADYIRIMSQNPQENSGATALTTNLSGRPDFPHSLGKADPLQLNVTSACLHFHTDGSVVDWGWRCYVYPGQDPMSEFAQGGGTIVESPHPYENNMDSIYVARLPGAGSLAVAFDQMSSTESGYDYISFWDMQMETRHGAEKYHGGRGGSAKNFPTTSDPLIIPGDSFKFKFHTDGSNVDWGWRLCVRPGPDTSTTGHVSVSLSAGSFTEMTQRPGAVVRESAHEYTNNEDYKGTVSISGANAIGVMFAPECRSEATHDWFTFLHSESADTCYPPYHISGGAGRWPGQSGRDIAVIPSNTFAYHWHTDGSNVAWGWKFVAFPVEYEDPLMRYMTAHDAQIVESDHPYANNVDATYRVHIPGARWIRVAFDPNSSTETNHDFVSLWDGEGENANQYGLAKYCGGRNYSDKVWAGVGSHAVAAVRGDTCIIKFHTDGSNVDYGWRAAVWMDNDYVDPWDQFMADHPGGTIVETEHPYTNNLEQDFTVSLGGTNALGIIFHPQSRTEGCDTTKVYDNNTGSDVELCGTLSGRPVFPHTCGSGEPVIVRSNNIRLHFHTDGSVVDWGWRAYVFPASDPFLAFAGSNHHIVESDHPYANNENRVWEERFSGASALLIAFDGRSSTERSYDYVVFEVDGTRVGEEKYHGGRGGSEKNFPTPNNPLRIAGDHVTIKFHSDGSNVDYGFVMAIKPE